MSVTQAIDEDGFTATIWTLDLSPALGTVPVGGESRIVLTITTAELTEVLQKAARESTDAGEAALQGLIESLCDS
jgi:hypothetical protein